jgi:hypothetical protein
MTTRADGSALATRETVVARLLHSKAAAGLASIAPIPLFLVKSILVRDNAKENRKDSWQRLRESNEAARYHAVRRVTERYARDGFVLDVGCSQGILQEGLTYGRYLGVDNCEQSIALAAPKSDVRTDFVCADGSTLRSSTTCPTRSELCCITRASSRRRAW